MKNKKYLYTYRIADIVFSIFSKNEIRTTENFFPFIYQGEKKDFIIQLEEKESMPFEMNNVLFENYIFKAGKDKEQETIKDQDIQKAKTKLAER